MQTYICLLRWTNKGLEDIKDSPSRLDAARRAFESTGLTMKAFYMVMGQYDIVAVMEAPNDDSMAKGMLSQLLFRNSCMPFSMVGWWSSATSPITPCCPIGTVGVCFSGS